MMNYKLKSDVPMLVEDSIALKEHFIYPLFQALGKVLLSL